MHFSTRRNTRIFQARYFPLLTPDFTFFFNWEDGFQQQSLTEVNVRKLILDVKFTKETLAMIDTVSVVIHDINPKLI